MSRHSFAPGVVVGYHRPRSRWARLGALVRFLAMLCVFGSAMVGAALMLGHLVGVFGG